MTKSESKYFNTARIMDESLIELLCKKDIQFISVKEICEKAGVNRSTFYLHYETIADLLQETIEYIQEEFEKSFTFNADEFVSGIGRMPLNDLVLINDKYLIPYLNFVKEHKHIYKATLNNPVSMQSESRLSELYRHVLKPIFMRFGIPDEEQRYWLVYHINGVMAIVTEWLEGNCNETVEEMVRVIENCVPTRNVSGRE
ncbi:MAG: TetR/AcrR family transcriptional regulator [Acutalibacteraceae bacterium]